MFSIQYQNIALYSELTCFSFQNIPIIIVLLKWSDGRIIWVHVVNIDDFSYANISS